MNITNWLNATPAKRRLQIWQGLTLDYTEASAKTFLSKNYQGQQAALYTAVVGNTVANTNYFLSRPVPQQEFLVWNALVQKINPTA